MNVQKKVFIPAGITLSQRQKQKDLMEKKLVASGWIVKEYVDGGSFKPSYFTVEGEQSNKIPSALPTWQKAAIFFIGFIFLAAIFGPSPEDKQPAKPDKELVQLYYKDLMAKTDNADQIYAPFATALERGKLLEATQIALNIKQPVSSAWGEVSQVMPPKLKNQEAKKKLDQAHEAISGAYLYKASIVSDYLDLADSQSLKKIAEIKDKSEKVPMLMIGGIANMSEAFTMVGLKADDMKK